jgi:hypothetical protein
VLPHDVLDHLLDAVRGGASPVPDGTWTHWPLATDGLGGMLTAPASRHQARQTNWQLKRMLCLDPTGRLHRRDGGDAIDIPPELPGGPP